MDKKALRALVRQRKKECPPEERERQSERIMARLERDPRFRAAERVLVYWPLPHEVSTCGLIRKYRGEKRFFLPVMRGEELEIRPFGGEEALRCENALGVLEPVSCDRAWEVGEMDLAVVPGMAYDRKGNRLGRGKGYYDRLLKGYRGCKLGICFDFQLLDAVPADAHDVPVDGVICGEEE